MSGPVSYAAASVSLASLPVLETLAAKGPLVDSPIFSAAERHAEVLQLEKRNSKKHYNVELADYNVKNSGVYYMLLLVAARTTHCHLKISTPWHKWQQLL